MNLKYKGSKNIDKYIEKNEDKEIDKNNKFKSVLNIINSSKYIKTNKLIEKNKKQMKDDETNTDSYIEPDKRNKKLFKKNLIEINSIENIIRPPSSNTFYPYIYDNLKISNNNFINKCNSQKISNLKQISFKTFKDNLINDKNNNIKKRFFSAYKNQYNENINNNKNIQVIHYEKKKKNINDNNLNNNNNNLFKKKINNFFKNKFLQENTDIFQLEKFLFNKNNLNIKFSLPQNFNNYKEIVVDNISLENTFKKQTVSNFNNKYFFKFKKNNLKEKEKIKKLFNLLKKHKNSDIARNSDFLAFKLYKQKKLKEKELYRALYEEFSSPCVYIGRNKNFSINNDFTTNKYDSDIIQNQKGNKMIKIKSLQINN